jgi:hypothetical protein
MKSAKKRIVSRPKIRPNVCEIAVTAIALKRFERFPAK